MENMTTNKIQRLAMMLVTLLMATTSWAYKLTLDNASGNPNIIATLGDNGITWGTTDVIAGSNVTLTVDGPTTAAKYLTTLKIEAFVDAGGAGAPRRAIEIQGPISVRTVTEYQVYEFTMPNYDVKITPTFENRISVSDVTVLFTEGTRDATTGNYSRVYDFLTHTPVIQSVKKGDTPLAAGTDYTISDISGMTNVSSQNITITGVGKYTGSKTITYSVTQRSIADATINLSEKNFVYLKDENQRASISGVFVKGQELHEHNPLEGDPHDEYDADVRYYEGDCSASTAILPSTSYTYATVPSVNAGTYTIVIKGHGNFDPNTNARVKYTINQKDISSCDISPAIGSFTYTGGSITFSPTIKDKNGHTLAVGSTNDYTITDNVQTDVGGYSATVTGVNNYTGSVNVPFTINVSNDGYYIVFESAKTTYSPSFSTTHSETYTGSQIELTPGTNIYVKKQSGTAPASTDEVLNSNYYRLVYNNNINVGTATVTAVGKGGYDFTAVQTFEITAKDITSNENITVTLGTETLTYNGNKQRPTVTVHDADRNVDLRENIDYTLSEGAVNAGNTHTVTVTGIGNYTGAKTSGYYTIGKLTMTDENTTIILSYNSTIYNRGEQKPVVEKVTVDGLQLTVTTDYTLSYQTADYTSQGSKTITISGVGNYDGSKNATYTINPKPITSDMVTLSSSDQTNDPFVNNSFTYNGSSHVPVVTVKDGTATLTPSTATVDNDYRLTNAGGTAVGVYYATVEGKGNYTGKVEAPYSIVSNNSDTGVDVTYSEDPEGIIYTGSAITLHLTVTKGGTPLTEGSANDYEVVYNNNINAGEATISVIGRNNYNFVKHIQFIIKPRPLTADMVTLSANNFIYNGSVQKPAITITYNGVRTEGSDYKLTNEGRTDVGTGYYKVEGEGNFTGTLESSSDDMEEKRYTISTLDISSTSTVVSSVQIVLYPLADPVYNGTAKEPGVQKVVVTKSDASQLVFTSGFNVGYSNNKDVATSTTAPTVTISGTNFGSSTASTTFTIQPKPLTDDMVVLNTTIYTYDGTPKEPTATVTDEALPSTFASKVLTLNTDYTVAYTTDHTTPGDKAATITGKGNYTGTISKPYTIVGASGVTIDWADAEAVAAYVYDGTAKEPAVTVTKGETTTLTLNTDYTVSWSNNVNAGTNTAYITVTGKGNYDFTQTKTFSIAKKEMTNAMVTLENNTFTYDGNLHKPTVTVSDGSPSIITSDDYTISNNGNINAGDYTVTVTATSSGNYSGSGSKSYTISPLSISSGEVNLSYNSIVFNGSVQKPTVQTVYANGHQLTATTDYTISWPETDYTNQGVKTVTVTGTGNYKGSKNATYTIEQKEVNSSMITLSGEGFNTVTNSFTYDGASHSPTVTVANGTLAMALTTDYTLTNPTHTEVGNYVVQIDGVGNYKGTATKQYSIVTAGSTAFTVEAIAAQTYTGAALKPEPVVKATVNGVLTTLTKDKHYTVTWANNINAGENTASATVTGLDNYAGTQTVYFTINPKDLIANETTLSATAFSYNGTEQKPTVTVTDGGTMLVKDKDYTLAFPDDMINQGTKTITIKGTGNYAGQFTKTYNINQLSLSSATIILATLSSYVYDGAAKTPAVQLVKVGELVVPATAYDVAYASNTNAGTATVTVTAKASTNFKDGNSTTFNIERKDVTSDMIYLSSENLEYTGSLQAPTVTVKDGTKVLALTTDYTLSNPGGTAVGTYEATITGQGNYKGSAKKQYSIIAEGATGFTVDEITGTFTYSGSPQTPAVTVKKAGTTTVLTLGTDYTVDYTNNTNVGTATVTVTGKGNYSGTHAVNFTIGAKSLTSGMVALSSEAFTYNGGEQRPTVTVTDTDTNMPLKENTDFTVTYPADVVSQGTKTVTIRGIGNYTSEVTKTYTIGLLSLDNASVTLNELSSYAYDGTEKKPTVREVTVGTMVVPTTGYTVSYPDDVINQGVKTMTITGTGNYTGKTTKQYTVTPKMVSNDMIQFDNVNLIHTGGVLKPVVTVKDNGKLMKEDTDYTLVNDGATEVGTYWVYITGKGNYSGNASRSYNIITQGASVFSVSTIGSVEYNGKEQEPAVTVIDNSTADEIVLTKGLHYTVGYSNNKNAGTATVIVTGIGVYAGTVTKNFTITPKPLKSSMVTLAPVTDATTGTVHFTYNGLAQQPTVSVSDVPEGETTSILMDNDYAVSNPGAINAGVHPVTVAGRGNYTGSVTLNYYIDALSIEGAAITLYQQASNVYTGKEQKPGVREVVVGSGTSTLAVPTSGYSITGYANNINVGTATVTITGQGNFIGTASTTFDITKKPLTADMVTLDSETFTYTGGVLKPVVTVSDGEGDDNIIKASDYTVSNDGGKEVGEYKVTVNATAAGNYSGAVTRTFSIVSKGTATFDVALTTTSVVFDGTAKTPGVTVTDGGVLLTVNDDYSVSYTDNVNVGTATVTVTGKGNYAGTKTGTFEITPRPLTSEMVTLSATSFVYNGAVQKPEVTVKDGTILTTNDYTVTNNGGTHVGIFHVMVDGKGNYTGQVDKTFAISQLSLSDANVVLNELQSYTYDGKAKKPSVREVMAGGIMVPTTGYTVSYGENVNVGTGTVTITGQGDFMDSKMVSFDIVQKAVEDQMITLSNYEYTYTGSLLKPEVTVRDGETTLTPDKDYTLKNDGGTAVGSYEVTITGQGNYKGSASKSFVIKTKEAGVFEVTLSAESLTFTGSEQQPAVTVKDGETVLTAGTHYTVAYQNNVNVGTATVVVTGQGQYEGQKSKTFLITPKTLNDEMVTLSEEYFIYNAMLQRPVVTVNDGSALTVNDYMVSNEGGQNVGTYKVTVTGRNNYTGTVTKEFNIAELSLEDAQVVLYQLQSYIYDGQAKAPGVREVLVGNIVVPSNCYTTTMTANVNVGRVVVTVTGQGNYTGSASTTFDIKAKPVTTAMMTLTPEVFYYNGMNQKPAVEVQDGDLAMKAGTDYTLTNAGGVEAGLYDVVLQGMGNYTGEAVKKFTILISGVNTFTVILEESSVVYNGQEQRPAVTVKKDEQVLSEGRDYTVAYANNKDVGTATVVVTGLGDYEGSQMKTFVITPKALTDEMVTLDKTTFTYTGSKLQPVVTVSDGDIMTENDYVVTNEGGTEVGEYEVKVDGQNNYMGTVTKTYTIVKSDINVDVPTTGGGDDPNVEDVTLTLTSTGENGDNAVVTGVVIPEADQSKDLGITIPATVTVNGQTYNVTGLGSGCFAGVDNLTDIYLPDTEEPLTIGENAIPVSTKVHTPLALLDDYALMPTLEENFKDGKVMTTVTAKNRYWTFSCGVDVCVPDGVTVYTVHERSNTSVALVQLTEYDLMVGGQPLVKANNGVLIAGSANTDYNLVASAKRMTSGTPIGTYDSKDYGPQNLLIPVIVPTHFESGEYYVMKDNQFRSIRQDGEEVKVPACKAVLYLKSSQQSPQLSLDIYINEKSIVEDDGDDWFDIEGRKLEGRPTTKGVFIHNKQKIVIK